jgi:LacI family transcriptional regulator
MGESDVVTGARNSSPNRQVPDLLPELPGSKPTLKTISRLSGLAVPTVSRALSDAPDIGAETKKLVRRIADELGYVPNRAGVRLRTGRTNVISLVLSTEHDMMNHTARLISSLAGALRDTSYHLIMTPYFPGEDPMKPIRYIVETGSADAVIFNQTQPDDPRVAWLMDRGFPFATHGRTNWAERHAWFDYDNRAFGRMAVHGLWARGRRNILLVAPPMMQTYAQHIVDGAFDMARTTGVQLTESRDYSSDSGSDAVRIGASATLAAHPDIDGIICSSTSAVMAVVAALESAGRVLGQDIDVFGKEAIPFLNLFRPQIMALQENVSQAGEFLARAAIQAVREPDLPPMQGLDVPVGLG